MSVQRAEKCLVLFRRNVALSSDPFGMTQIEPCIDDTAKEQPLTNGGNSRDWLGHSLWLQSKIIASGTDLVVKPK